MYSHAFFYQRARFQPVFTVAEGLTFTTRFDVLEKQWGNTNWKTGTIDYHNSRRNQGYLAGEPAVTQTQKIQENIEFERFYVTFDTKIGQFQVGYQNVDAWGTDFADYNNTAPRIIYATKMGPVQLAFIYEKLHENDTAGYPAISATSASTPTLVRDKVTAQASTYTNLTDGDNDTYALAATYYGKGFEAGLLYRYYALNAFRDQGVKIVRNLVSPYFKGTFGAFYLEGEFQYWFGKSAQFEAPFGYSLATTPDVDLKAYGAYLKGQMNVGPAYFGALFFYLSGNDLSDSTKDTANPGGHGSTFVHSLILFNEPLDTFSNSQNKAAAIYNVKPNYIGYAAFAGFNPTPKLKLEAWLNYATVDKKALAAGIDAGSDTLGTELDVMATYKIYDNLSYMVGAGYLWTGNYWKYALNTAKTAAVEANKTDNNYILMNQLTLTF